MTHWRNTSSNDVTHTTPTTHSKTRDKGFWLYLIFAVTLTNIPLINVPFVWLATYFHEISHGIASLITGGDIVSIQLFLNGSGLCTTRGGNALLISFAGYSGAVLWGVLLYRVASHHDKTAKTLTLCLTVLIAVSILLYVRDLLTLIICLCLIGVLGMSLKVQAWNITDHIMKFVAMVVLINSLTSPLYLIDGRSFGDGASMAELTLVPEIVWVVIWCAIGVSGLYYLGKRS